MSKRDSSVTEFFRTLRFAIVGLAATLVHLLLAQGLFATGAISALFANLVGFAIAFAVGFWGHHHFTFAGSAPFGRAFRRYSIIAVTGFFVNNVALLSLVSGGFVGERVALTIAILIVPIGTYVASRFWGFRPVCTK